MSILKFTFHNYFEINLVIPWSEVSDYRLNGLFCITKYAKEKSKFIKFVPVSITEHHYMKTYWVTEV
jgi:hypothetical protein